MVPPSKTVAAAKDPTRINVLGVAVSAINMDQALATIERWIRNGERHYVTVSGVHGVMESQRDESLRRIHNLAGLVTPDGMPLVWLGRLFGGSHVDRVYGPDLLLASCKRFAAFGCRHFFYGGKAGVADRLVERLTGRFPTLKVVGTYSPPFRPLTPAEDEELIERINGAAPDIVWVGLSTPKQERWMFDHIERLRVPALIGVGAAFDFHAGLVRQAPRLMQRSGTEWLFRLAVEPRRLWKRYLVNNPAFVWQLLLQITGLRRHPLRGEALWQ